MEVVGGVSVCRVFDGENHDRRSLVIAESMPASRVSGGKEMCANTGNWDYSDDGKSIICRDCGAVEPIDVKPVNPDYVPSDLW